MGTTDLGDLLTLYTDFYFWGNQKGGKHSTKMKGLDKIGEKPPERVFSEQQKTLDVAKGSPPSFIKAHAKLDMCSAAWQAGYCEFQPESQGMQTVLLAGKCCLCCR